MKPELVAILYVQSRNLITKNELVNEIINVNTSLTQHVSLVELDVIGVFWG